MSRERALIRIHGIVQGVGFRPFVHRLVREHALSGFIKNTSSGVELELEGERAALEAFLADLPKKMPRLAMIDGIESRFGLPLAGYDGFEIRMSRREELRNTLISPDIAICDDCLHELLTPSDRRYRYPFINCTNCGPRFTIIKDVPYDRDRTSMGSFPMCEDCDREYHDIENRRYHAQPDACPVCGPHIFYTDAEGNPVAEGEAALHEAQQALLEGKIVAVKGLGGVHLACRCDEASVVQTLRRRKQRDEKPFAVMCRDAACARELCEISLEEEAVLTSVRRPIVLLKKRAEKAEALSHLSENAMLGVMLPYTPLHVLLFEGMFDALVMTSANISDTPIVKDNGEAVERLRHIADGFLLHNRDIQTRCDDSLCAVVKGKEYFLRRSRGYVPFPVRCGALPAGVHLLACGAEQKASFCLTKGDYAFPSQHIGDLKNYETLSHYEQQIAHFERLFDIVPRGIACDLHPDYLSTEFAKRSGFGEFLDSIYRAQETRGGKSPRIDHVEVGTVTLKEGRDGRSPMDFNLKPVTTIKPFDRSVIRFDVTGEDILWTHLYQLEKTPNGSRIHFTQLVRDTSRRTDNASAGYLQKSTPHYENGTTHLMREITAQKYVITNGITTADISIQNTATSDAFNDNVSIGYAKYIDPDAGSQELFIKLARNWFEGGDK